VLIAPLDLREIDAHGLRTYRSTAAVVILEVETLGNLIYRSMKYGQELSMAAFCVGAMLFYYLLYKSRIVPRVLSLWGLLAVLPCLVATVSALTGGVKPLDGEAVFQRLRAKYGYGN
jgi:hypothetical protein